MLRLHFSQCNRETVNLFLVSLGYLESWSGVKPLNNLSVVKETVSSVSDGYHSPAAAVNVDAVHVSKCQSNVCGGLGQDGETLVGRVGALGETQHGHSWELVDCIERSQGVIKHLSRKKNVTFQSSEKKKREKRRSKKNKIIVVAF